jgi:hypothetical protein
MEVEQLSSEQLAKKHYDGLFETLKETGLEETFCAQYADLLQKHEIDVSILKSSLLNHELLKEIGIEKMGHRLK